MARPPLPVGTAGAVSITEVAPRRYRARCRYRDHAGRVHHIERTGASKTAARNALTEAVKERAGLRVSTLRPHHKVDEAIKLYRDLVARRHVTGEIAATTRDRYMDALVYISPRLGSLRLSEVSIGAVEQAFSELADEGLSANTRRVIRGVATQLFDLCVRHGAMAQNPVRFLPRIVERRRKAPKALTAREWRRLFEWLDNDQSREAQLARQRGMPDMMRFMLGTGVRIGEMLAVTWADVDLDGTPIPLADGGMVLMPTVRITGNIVRVRGAGLVRHAGKTEQSVRTIPIPRFLVDTLRARKPAEHEPSEPIFPQVSTKRRTISWREPSHVMVYMSDVGAALDWEWFSSHVLRKTAATILHEAGISDRSVGEHIGHTDRASLLNVYLGAAELDPRLVNALDAAVSDS